MAGKLGKFQMVGFSHWKGELTGQALVKLGKIGGTPKPIRVIPS